MRTTKTVYDELFEQLIEVLNKYQTKDGAIEVLGFLGAARENYSQGSIDHMLRSLLLAWEHAGKLDPEISKELRSVVSTFVAKIFAAAAEMSRLSEEYEVAGGKPLSREEINEEVNARRGAS